MPVRNKILTAKAQRTQRGYFLFGGERPPTDVVGPPNKKSPEHDEMYLFHCHRRERKMSLFPKGLLLWSNRLSRLDHKQKDPFAVSAALR
jgi:hypothetical protein